MLDQDNTVLRDRVQELQERFLEQEHQIMQLSAHLDAGRGGDHQKRPNATVAEEVQRVAEVVEGKNRRIGELEGRIGDLERELEEVRAKEYDDVIANTQKMSEIDLQFMQLKKRIEDQARDKRLIEEDLYSARDKLKEILREKLAVQNEFH